MRSKGKNDIDNLPQADLKKLIQGTVWRDEHFTGTHIQSIANRENYSSRYVRNAIVKSLEA